MNVALPSGQSTTLSFLWNTTGTEKGNYTIEALAQILPGETNVEDNVFYDGWVYICVSGDVDGNKIVNMLDLYKTALDFGAVIGQPSYVLNYDVDGNGIINMLDLYIAAMHFGQTDP